MPIGAYKLNAISRLGSAATPLDTVFKLVRSIANPNANTTDTDDAFGRSADVNNTYFVVGAPRENASSTSDAGIAYVFSSMTGNLVSTLTNPYPNSDDYTGLTVAISTTRAIVGEYGTLSTGNVYIYTASSGTLLYTLNNPDPPSGQADSFGQSVDISENYAIVSQFDADLVGYNSGGSGRVYIYNATSGSLLYNIPNPYPRTVSFNRFGYDVGITDQYAVVGDNTMGNAYVYSTTTGNLVYTLQANTMTQVQTVDISQSYVAVGNPFYNSNSGRVYVFNLSDGSLRYTIDNPNAYASATGDNFGSSVRMSDSYVQVFAEFEDSANSTTSNRAISYIFNTATGALVQTLTSAYGNVSQQLDAIGITDRYAIQATTPDGSQTDTRILFYSRVSSDVEIAFLANGYVVTGYVASVA